MWVIQLSFSTPPLNSSQLHQLLPPLLSILLHSSLHQNHSTHLRTAASSILAHLLTQHATTYPSLAPRIMKTLLVALVAPDREKGTREGAVRGLAAVGREAVRKGLVEAGGARIIGEECTQGEISPVVHAVLVCCTTCCLLRSSMYLTFRLTGRFGSACDSLERTHNIKSKQPGGCASL